MTRFAFELRDEDAIALGFDQGFHILAGRGPGCHSERRRREESQGHGGDASALRASA
jgi:hypothetical protein